MTKKNSTCPETNEEDKESVISKYRFAGKNNLLSEYIIVGSNSVCNHVLKIWYYTNDNIN